MEHMKNLPVPAEIRREIEKAFPNLIERIKKDASPSEFKRSNGILEYGQVDVPLLLIINEKLDYVIHMLNAIKV